MVEKATTGILMEDLKELVSICSIACVEGEKGVGKKKEKGVLIFGVNLCEGFGYAAN